MAISLLMIDSHFQIITKLSGLPRSAVKDFDPSKYITSIGQPRPVVTIIQDNHVMFARTVYEEEIEEFGRVPIYFYDPYAPTNDYWPIDEVNNSEAEEVREEESADNDPLDEISLNLLFDERVTNNEIRVIRLITNRFGNWWGFVGTRRVDNSDEAEIEAQPEEITTIANQMALQDLQGDNDESANQSDNKVLMINLSDEKDCSELILDAEKGAYPNWTMEHTLKYQNADFDLSSDSDSESTQSESSSSSFQTTESSEENLDYPFPYQGLSRSLPTLNPQNLYDFPPVEQNQAAWNQHGQRKDQVSNNGEGRCTAHENTLFVEGFDDELQLNQSTEQAVRKAKRKRRGCRILWWSKHQRPAAKKKRIPLGQRVPKKHCGAEETSRSPEKPSYRVQAPPQKLRITEARHPCMGP
ncbi:hypothetical protein RHMOL_Rhmol11G0043800 [Rhododendron molle]|uniref:Uncharacterized protein n=1 Tax=Rhododendron molle TaxID=49168 RepID=A0ACC0LPL2_RHOML|nr:hypothetical protein RHMOL_Rhmol11G0043800 [Rhododendron molle]